MTQSHVEPVTAAEDAGDGSRPPAGRGWLDRYFHITRRRSTIGQEVRGGLTTFMAMAYILLLNPVLIGGADVAGHRMPHSALITATALGGAVTTLLMGFVGKVPLALAAGLSVAGVMSTQVATRMTWPQAMGMSVIYGLVIVVLVVSGLREAIMNAIPLPLKHGITIGIGLFIAVIGLVNAKFVGLGTPSDPVTLGVGGHLQGWPVLVFCVTLVAIFMLQARNVRGAVLLGIVGGTVLAVIVQAAGLTKAADWGLNVPQLPHNPLSMPDFSLFGHVEFGGFGQVGYMTVAMIVFTLVLAGFFDAMATIIGVGTEAGLADKQGRMPGLSKALLIDGAGGAIGGVVGGSGQTVFIESATGVAEGARTGLSSVVTGVLFACALFFTPVMSIVPTSVAAAALVVIGSMMMGNARHVDWGDRSIGIPVFLTVALMPFTYSITPGVGAGVISFCAIKLAQGKWREPGAFMWVLSVVFIVYFALHPLQSWLGVH
ncbi:MULTISPECIES: NCS2 family permease [Streptomycetaceae]|uniref:Permease n=1 Tax=Streptantibioticus cattleyicolor (strain ATCC 35852 / DSM 46488 / JCM 4925 / NBRC 14057 / NRRL 8057) TaxID=1003195 RepID=F8JXM3_STREN|nr:MULTISPECIES: NCS2 family permease [Streptomycetaceae]AEW97125.1 permease [Streptantibioticus cattleyicolor NRRL 8057 = DSM 46488]MYS61584.1 NCS2 family permease [Streptomyces sp. SID5468]CCB77449.1 Permease SC6C509 [Streptantibioticus cattleyicolor NRRL 8057 = DSM 46488]